MEVIKCENLQVKYGNEVVISDANFALDRGELLCIVGEKRAGKSTLLKAIMGFVKASKGKVIIDKDTKKKGIGFVPQDDSQSGLTTSVGDVIKAGSLVRKSFFIRSNSKDDKYEGIVNALKLNKVEDRTFSDLSGGQRKKVILARALMATEDLLVMDNPMAELDPLACADFLDIVVELNKAGISVLMATGDEEIAKKTGGRLLYLRDGILTDKKWDFLEN